MSKRIAIVGTASCSIGAAPWGDPGVEFWGIPSLHKFWPERVARIDTWFEIHKNFESIRPEWLEWAVETQPHAYLVESHPRLRNSEAYPIADVVGRFDGYMTSTVAYMLAMAIMQEADQVGLYGVDMATASEYFDQRPCCEYLIGMARGMGIKVDVPVASSLLKSPWLYGYNTRRPTKRKERERDELANWRCAALAIRDKFDPNLPIEDMITSTNGGLVFNE